MTYKIALIAQNPTLLRNRINALDAPAYLRATLGEAVNDLTLSDTSPNDYVVIVEAEGDSAADAVTGTFSVRRIAALDNITSQPRDGQGGPTPEEYAITNPGAPYPPAGFDARGPSALPLNPTQVAAKTVNDKTAAQNAANAAPMSDPHRDEKIAAANALP